MLQQRPILSQPQQIKGLEPEIGVRENNQRTNQGTMDSKQKEYNFEKAMAATRQQMDRQLEAKRQEQREASLRANEKQQQAAQQSERDNQRRVDANRHSDQTAPQNNTNNKQDRLERNASTEERNAAKQKREGTDANERAEQATPIKSQDDSRYGSDEQRASDQKVKALSESANDKGVVADTNNKGSTEAEKPELTKTLKELEAFLQQLVQGSDSESTDSKAAQMLEKLAALLANKSPSSETNAASSASSTLSLDKQLSELINDLKSLLTNKDQPGIDPLSQLVNNIDIESVLEQMSQQMSQLQAIDTEGLTENQKASLSELQEQLKALMTKLNSFSDSIDNDTNEQNQPIESKPDLTEGDETALRWLNDVVLKLKSSDQQDSNANARLNADKIVASTEDLIQTTKSQTTNGDVTIVRADLTASALAKGNHATLTVNDASAQLSNGKGDGKSDGNIALAQQISALLNNKDQSSTQKPPVTTPIQLQGALSSLQAGTQSAMGQTTNQVQANGAEVSSDDANLENMKFGELQRLMSETGTSKSSQLKSLVESGLFADAASSEKVSSAVKPQLVDVAGVQLDKMLQAPKLESIAQTKTDAVIKENILFNKQALASNVQAQVGMMLARNMKSVDIRLDPPELGSMQIKLSLGEQANVSFVVSSQQAKDALEESLPRLKELLEQQGMQLGDSDVTQDNRNSDSEEQEDGQIAKQAGDSEQGTDGETDDEGKPIEVTVKSPWQVDDYA